MLLALTLFACTSKTDDSAIAPAPTVAWLTPADTDLVAVGDVSCALIVEGLTLEDPAKHSEGGAEGFVRISVDGTQVKDVATTTFTLTLAAGAHDLSAALYYIDGDAISATTDRLCAEDDTDTACAAVAETISVTAQ